MRIELVGGIASGKSTLAAALGQPSLVEEDFKSNPFYAAFYREAGAYAFQAEITYLLQHFSGLGDALRAGIAPIVSDFSLALDLAYARVTLTREDFEVFDCVLRRVLGKIGPPNVVVLLSCDPSIALTRIRQRARSEEQSISLEFLRAIDEASVQALEDPRFSQVQILKLDSSALDFRLGGRDRAATVSKVLRFAGVSA